jgi:hypothetical protein
VVSDEVNGAGVPHSPVTSHVPPIPGVP